MIGPGLSPSLRWIVNASTRSDGARPCVHASYENAPVVWSYEYFSPYEGFAVVTAPTGTPPTIPICKLNGAGAAPTFTVDNPDFRTHSLRGNAVVRWEYRPGSALFFVWQQERSDFLPLEGDFRTRREIRQIFGRPGNVFLVKATYWFAR